MLLEWQNNTSNASNKTKLNKTKPNKTGFLRSATKNRKYCCKYTSKTIKLTLGKQITWQRLFFYFYDNVADKNIHFCNRKRKPQTKSSNIEGTQPQNKKRSFFWDINNIFESLVHPLKIHQQKLYWIQVYSSIF